MITIEMIRDAIAADEMTWSDYREAKKELREDLAALESVFDQTRDGSVSDSVAAMVRDSYDRFFSRYGFHCTMTGAADRVRDLVASLVNRSAWDGRISRSVKEWAESREDATDAELANKMELYTRIHMAHLDQIAAALMAYTPEDETAEDIPAEEIADAVAEAVAESIPSFTVLYDYRIGGEYIPQQMTVNAETAADAVALVKELHRIEREAGNKVSFPYHVRVEGEETAPRVASAAVSVARVTAPVVVDREQERAALVASRIMDRVREYDRSPVESLAVSLSDGNDKIGHIKNVSQAPVVSCSGVCKQCGGHCYDGRAVLQYPDTAAARARNWSIYTRDPAGYFAQILAAVQRMRRRFFRWHVGGEIVDSRYLAGMVEIARAVPRVTFLVFTKRHALVNDYCAEHGGREAIPENLRVIFSAWPGSPLVNPYFFPVSAPYVGARPRGWTGCPGNCEHCAEHARGCWTASAGDVIGFKYHGAIADSFAEEFSAWTAPEARKA